MFVGNYLTHEHGFCKEKLSRYTSEQNVGAQTFQEPTLTNINYR